MATIQINLSDSDVKGFEAAPSGSYRVEITEAELTESNSAKNPGKPLWKLTLSSIDKDKYNGNFMTWVPLWQGAHFSLVSLGKALGFIEGSGALTVPDVDSLIGKEVVVKVTKTYSVGTPIPNSDRFTWDNVTEEEYVKAEKAGKEVRTGNNVKSYAPVAGGAKKASAKSSKFTL